MRLFIAISLEPTNYFISIQNIIRDFDIHATFPEQFHCTLKFLGNISELKLSEIKLKLGQIKFDSFETKITRIGVFPNYNFIRIVWLGLDSGVLKVKAYIDRIMGGVKDSKFIPHVTIIRVKKAGRDLWSKLNAIKIENVSFQVTKIQLIKSKLTPNGRDYQVIAEYGNLVESGS